MQVVSTVVKSFVPPSQVVRLKGFFPKGLAIDSKGRLYVSDTSTHSILKIYDENEVIIWVGGSNYGYQDGFGTTAKLGLPYAITIDENDNLFIVEFGNHGCIRKVDNLGFVTTVAGGKRQGFKDGITGEFNTPRGIALDNDGNILVADTNNNAIRLIYQKTGFVKTIVGLSGMSGFKDGPVASALLDNPYGIAVNRNGSIYISDAGNNRIRMLNSLNSTGCVTTVAGDGTENVREGQGTQSSMIFPYGLRFDSNDNLHIAEYWGNVILKMNTTGFVSILVGTGKERSLDGTAKDAQLNGPQQVAFDPRDGGMYITETGAFKIRKMSRQNYVSTIVSLDRSAKEDGTLSEATFTSATGIALDAKDNMYISDVKSNSIMYVDLIKDDVRTLIMSDENLESQDGLFSNSSLKKPRNMEFDINSNSLYFLDDNLLRVANFTTKTVNTLSASMGECGYDDTPSINCSLSYSVKDLAFGEGGEIFIASLNSVVRYKDFMMRKVVGYQNDNNFPCKDWFGLKTINGISKVYNGSHYLSDKQCKLILKFEMVGRLGNITRTRLNVTDPSIINFDNYGNLILFDDKFIKNISVTTGKTSIIAGCKSNLDYPRNGPVDKAVISELGDIVVNSKNELYFTDSNSVRRVIGGNVETVAGEGAIKYFLGFANGVSLKKPFDIVFNPDTNVLFASDSLNNCIVRINAQDFSSVIFAGNGGQGWLDGPGLEAQFFEPRGLAINPLDGNYLFVCDYRNHVIRKIDQRTSFVSTYMGTGNIGYMNGNASIAEFNYPTALVFDSSGDLYVSDSRNHVIRKIKTSTNTTIVFCGTSGTPGFKDGFGVSSSFNYPTFLAFSPNNSVLYVSDTQNHAIRRLYIRSGKVETLMKASCIGNRDGNYSNACFENPHGIAFDNTRGFLYVADTMNHAIRLIDLVNEQVTTISGTAGIGKADGYIANATFSFPLGIKLYDDMVLYVADSKNNAIRKIWSGNDIYSRSLSFSGSVQSYSTDSIIAISIFAPIAFLIGCMAAYVFVRRYKMEHMLTTKKLQAVAVTDNAHKHHSGSSATETISVTETKVISVPGYKLISNLNHVIKIDNEIDVRSGGTASVIKGKLIDIGLIQKYKIVDVAVKLVNESEQNENDSTQFTYEVALMEALPESPYLVKMICYSNNPKAIVMPYYGITMTTFLRDSKANDLAIVISKIANDIASGMDQIHDKNIVHFDLKPGNVMVDVESGLKWNFVICDFGFANFVNDSKRQLVAGFKKPSTHGITIRYAAPELLQKSVYLQHRLDSEIDKKIDVFAYAMTLFYCVTGEKPWANISDFSEIERLVIAGQRPVFPSNENPYIDIIVKCWSHDPVVRPTFKEILLQLKKLTDK